MKLIPLILLILFSSISLANDQVIRYLSQARANHINVNGFGHVIKVFSDKTKSPIHQRFVIKLDDGQTLIIMHNIDVGKRINNLRVNDPIRFFGEYVWHKRGGVIYSTHKDPSHHHENGWIFRYGKKYD